MRYASMMMSNVALATPTSTAAMATVLSACCGSTLPRNPIAAITSVPVNHSHERRGPKRPSSGMRTVSTSGAQRNLKLYARNTSANVVTALFVIPYCASRVVSVAPIIANAEPDEIPRHSAASGAGSMYGRTPAGT